MSDSEDSIDNELISRITRRRTEKKTHEPVRKSKTSKTLAKKSVKFAQEKTSEQPVENQRVIEEKYEENEPQVEPEEEPEEEVQEFKKVQEQSGVQEMIGPDTTPKEIPDAVKLSNAHTESKRLKRMSMRGEVKPTPKIDRIIKRRVAKTEPEPEPEVENEVLSAIQQLRLELSQLREAQASQVYTPAPPVMSDRQSSLLRQLTGRFL